MKTNFGIANGLKTLLDSKDTYFAIYEVIDEEKGIEMMIEKGITATFDEALTKLNELTSAPLSERHNKHNCYVGMLYKGDFAKLILLCTRQTNGKVSYNRGSK